ncbi:hypothetical protein C4B63_13g305 [Trypanosoma cruzi]|uniref:Uncharacterized protein n=1 Tax=Trypanosoma cruzi TaxID=5693 RepID=A0A2V2VS08_TRYCR|nr:hypothetical protein C4B63_13g305 [Trypanosoma cruzi]
MTSNDINAFKQYLWSLFQSYSYIPSGGGNGGPPARRLSESGYRAVISLVATADVMSRFFLAGVRSRSVNASNAWILNALEKKCGKR